MVFLFVTGFPLGKFPWTKKVQAVYVGSGGDGSVTISTSQNINTAVLGSLRVTNADGILTTASSFGSASGGITLTVASATGFAAGDEIMVINLRGDATNNGNVGKYEFLEIESISTNTLTFKTTIKNIYGATSSNLTLTGQSIVVQRIPQWTNVTINSGGTLTANSWNGTSGGIIVFRASGTVTVNTGGTINANALGYRGGTSVTTMGGLNGESYDGIGVSGTSSGGDDTISGSGGGNLGTKGGGSSSNSGPGSSPFSVSPSGTRGGGGGGGNADGNSTTDGAGGGGGGGYGFGGGGGGGGGDAASGGAGGTAGSTSINAGGGGSAVDNTVGGAGGNAGSAGGGVATLAAAGSGATTGEGGNGTLTTSLNIGAGAGGGGGSYGIATLATIFFGSGGGGGGGHDATTATAGATGGAGGGIIFILADTITLSGTDSITADGANGAAGSIARVGRSGGGAGGSIFLFATTVTLGTNLVTATGGSGVAAANPGGGGGAGGHGRIRVEATTITGTTNPTLSSSGISLFDQSAYRLFNNLDSTDVGTTLAAQDTAGILNSGGAVFRLRLLLHNTVATSVRTNPERFKLQFAQQSGTCDTGFVGETYADVTPSTDIAFKNNSTPTDNAALTANVNDPTHNTDTIVGQTYEEANTFGNTENNISINQDGKWDFALFDNGAPSGTVYCLRAVKSNGVVLNTYTVIPQVTIYNDASPTITAGITETQTSTLTIPSTGQYVGGAFTFIRSSGSANVTQIMIKENGTVNANSNLSGLKLYYKAEATCSTSFPSGTTLFNSTAGTFNASEQSTVTGSFAVGTSQICVYAKLDVGSGTTSGDTLEIEITNPSTDVTVSAGAISPATVVAITGSTILSTVGQILSLAMADASKNPTLFYISGGALWIKEGTSDAVSLTSSRTTVSALTFTNLTRATTPGTIRIQYTVTYSNIGSRNEYNFSKTFYGSASLRQP